MKQIDYDVEQYQHYARGRALSERQLRIWISGFADRLPRRRMPVPSGGADYALMFLSWHHVQDKPRAVCELARVIRPGGRMLLRSQFSDHMPRLWWLEYFPRGHEVDGSMYQALDEVIDIFEPAGWRVAGFGTITELSSGTRSERLERLRLRTYSTFAYFAPDELEVGFRHLEQAVAADPDTPVPDVPATMLTLERC